MRLDLSFLVCNGPRMCEMVIDGKMNLADLSVSG